MREIFDDMAAVDFKSTPDSVVSRVKAQGGLPSTLPCERLPQVGRTVEERCQANRTVAPATFAYQGVHCGVLGKRHECPGIDYKSCSPRSEKTLKKRPPPHFFNPGLHKGALDVGRIVQAGAPDFPQATPESPSRRLAGKCLSRQCAKDGTFGSSGKSWMSHLLQVGDLARQKSDPDKVPKFVYARIGDSTTGGVIFWAPKRPVR